MSASIRSLPIFLCSFWWGPQLRGMGHRLDGRDIGAGQIVGSRKQPFATANHQ